MISRIEINLIPDELLSQEKKLVISKAYIIAGAVAITLSLILLIYASVLDRQIADTQTAIANTRRQIDINRQIQDEIRSLESLSEEIRSRVGALQSINVNQGKWANVLEIYTLATPANTWFISIEEIDNLVTIVGMTEASAEVALFMGNLQRQAIIANVNLVEMRDAGRDGQLINFTLRHNFVDLDTPPRNN